jgi:hypothetical protein
VTDNVRRAIAQADQTAGQIRDELWRQQLIDAAEVGLRKDCQSKPCVDVVHRADAIRAVDAVLPLVRAEIAAAERRGAEGAAQAIKRRADQLAADPTATTLMYRAAIIYDCAAHLARKTVPAPTGDNA